MRQDQERIEVSVDGVDLGVFDGFTGGASDSEETRHRPGGMGAEESLGGPKMVTNFTVSRLYKLERDHGIYVFLHQKVGEGRVVAKRTKLTRDRAPSGNPITYTGVLKSVTPPDHDSNSSDRAMLSLEIVPDGEIA